MLITILTIGSRGDLQPYIALGIELKKTGQRVRIATFELFENFVKQAGLEFYPVHGDFSMVVSSEDGRSAVQADNPLKVLLSFRTLKTYVYQLQRDLFDACQGADAIVYHPGPSIGFFIAQQLGIPSILATPFPMTPTKDYPALIFYTLPRLGKGFNLISHKIFEQIMWSASNSAVRRFWKEEFGHLPEGFACPYPQQTTPALPTVVSCSNYVFPRGSDWPEAVHNTGYWFLDEEVDWKPSPDLLDFLDAGTPPVYVGFGSLGDPETAHQTTQLVIEALQRSGQRGLLATGWSGLAKLERVPDGYYILESAPHAWLFPRMAVVVHHGGAGTTAAGLRAGVPSIVIPYSNDQFAWGRRVYELGVGPQPIPKKKLTAERLDKAIQVALSPEVKAAAHAMGGKIRSEEGARNAAQVILDCLGQKRTD